MVVSNVLFFLILFLFSLGIAIKSINSINYLVLIRAWTYFNLSYSCQNANEDQISREGWADTTCGEKKRSNKSETDYPDRSGNFGYSSFRTKAEDVHTGEKQQKWLDDIRIWKVQICQANSESTPIMKSCDKTTRIPYLAASKFHCWTAKDCGRSVETTAS